LKFFYEPEIVDLEIQTSWMACAQDFYILKIENSEYRSGKNKKLHELFSRPQIIGVINISRISGYKMLREGAK
jgi:hypothetical protein